MKIEVGSLFRYIGASKENQQKSTQDKQQKRKEEYQGKAGTIKKELPIAKAELDLRDLMLEHTNCCKNKAGV